MRIDRIEGYLVRIPLKKEFRFADAPARYSESVVLRIDGEGASGWSEVTPGASPFLTADWSGATYLTLRDCVVPMLAELRAVANAKALDDAFKTIKGNNFAKAAVETAWQDLDARIKGVPLWKALGAQKKPIKLGLTFDRSVERDEFFKELARAVQEQYARVTLKLRPGWDVQVVNFSRLDSPSWLQLQVDVEGGLDMELHADTLFRMDDFFLTFVEQPLNPRDFVAHAMLKNSMRTPICLDESIESLEDAKIAFDLESCKFVCLKSDRVGGLSNALDIARFAKTNEINAYAGFELGTSLAWRAVLALAAAIDSPFTTDYLRFDELLEYDLIPQLTPTLVEEPGDEKHPPRSFRYVELWDEPGLGAEPNLEEMSKYVLDKFEIKV